VDGVTPILVAIALYLFGCVLGASAVVDDWLDRKVNVYTWGMGFAALVCLAVATALAINLFAVLF
jgi:hypothetical protein